jgi:hypothetical protein
MKANLMDSLLLKLNSAEYLPASAFRRNHQIYELVCYVNNLIACKLSENHDGLSLFKSRILEYTSCHPPAPDSEKYYELIRTLIEGID